MAVSVFILKKKKKFLRRKHGGQPSTDPRFYSITSLAEPTMNLRFHALSGLPEYYANQNDELTQPHSLLGIRLGSMGWMGMQHAKEKRDILTEYWSENMK